MRASFPSVPCAHKRIRRKRERERASERAREYVGPPFLSAALFALSRDSRRSLSLSLFVAIITRTVRFSRLILRLYTHTHRHAYIVATSRR